MQAPELTSKGLGYWVSSCQQQLAWLRRNEPAIPIEPLATARGAVLIVEPREDKNLEFTVRNWMHYVGASSDHKYSLVVCHSKKNRAFVEKLLEGSPGATLVELEQDDLRGQAYSNLMTDADFWRRLPCERLLLVQTDTLCLGGPGLAEVEDCDYVGAPWWLSCPKTGYLFKQGQGPYRPSACDQGWGLPELWPQLVGNGGLSLRNKSAMIQCCERFRLESVQAKQGDKRVVMVGSDGSDRRIQAEDVFFAVACKRLKKKVASRRLAERFAFEEVLPLEVVRGDGMPTSFGLHKIYAYHHPSLVKEVLETGILHKRIKEEE